MSTSVGSFNYVNWYDFLSTGNLSKYSKVILVIA